MFWITKKKSKKKVDKAWEDWDTASTIWNFDVGKKVREGVHGLEYREREKYQEPFRYIYETRKAFAGKLAPQLVEKLILKYSDEKDLVLDPFAGTGTTLVEARKHGRKCIGIELNPDLVELTNRKISQVTLTSNLDQKDYEVVEGDAREKLKKLDDESVDFVLAHPPYWNLIKFSEFEDDLCNLSLEEFLKSMSEVILELKRVLRPEKFLVIVIGDRRKSGVVPLGSYLMQIGLSLGLNLWDVMIYDTRFGSKQYGKFQMLKSKRYKFHLQDHDYILVFQKREKGRSYVELKELQKIVENVVEGD